MCHQTNDSMSQESRQMVHRYVGLFHNFISTANKRALWNKNKMWEFNKLLPFPTNNSELRDGGVSTVGRASCVFQIRVTTSLNDPQEMEAQIRDLLLLPYDNGSISIETEDIQIIQICECRPADKTLPINPPPSAPLSKEWTILNNDSPVNSWCYRCSELQARNRSEQKRGVHVASHFWGPKCNPPMPKEPCWIWHKTLVRSQLLIWTE